MYKNRGVGQGSIFSANQIEKVGGELIRKPRGDIFRLDYGKIHGSNNIIKLHTTVRYTYKGVTYGSTSQRNWYPSSLKPPFFKPIKKK